MGTFIVTGGTGRIGTEAVSLLASRGHQVRFATRSPEGAAARLRTHFGPGRVEAVRLDTQDPKALSKVFEGCQGALFVAPLQDIDAWHEAMASAVAQAELPYCVKVSVTGARAPDSDPPPGRFPTMHWRGEELLRGTGVPTTCVRPTIFAQHFLGLNPVLFRRGDDEFYLPTSDTPVAFLDCRDIALAATCLLTNAEHQRAFANESFELTGSTAVTAAEISDILSRSTGRTIRHVDGLEAYSEHAKAIGESDSARFIYAEALEGWFSKVDDEAFVRLTGHHTTSFAKFAYDHRHAF